MPIQIQCPSCGQALRVPETAIGKTVRCPKCQTTFAAAASDNAGSAPAAPTPPAPTNPFPPAAANPFDFGTPPAKPAASDPFAGFGSGNPSQPAGGNPFGDSRSTSFGPTPTNPYASPAGTDPMAPRELGGLTRQYLSFNGVLETTWKLFSDNMGVMFGVGAVFFGVNFALNILSNILAVGAQASGMIAIVIGAQFVNMAISFCVQTFMQIGGIVFGLNLIRTGRPNWSDVFAGGPHFVGGCLLSLAIGLINAAILLVCELPAIVLYIAQGPQQVQQQPEIVGTAAIIGVVVAAPIMILLLYRWIFAMPFLVDRRVGITEALQLSTQFTQGNKFTIFVIMLVVGILGTIIGILTCCLGFLGYISYFMVLMVVMYLQATGQMPVTALPPKLHPLQFPPGK